MQTFETHQNDYEEKYKVVFGHPADIAHQVNRFLAEGWQTSGPLVKYERGRVAQVMIKVQPQYQVSWWQLPPQNTDWHYRDHMPTSICYGYQKPIPTPTTSPKQTEEK